MGADELEQATTGANNMNEASFDEYGRCIPASIEAPTHKESRRYFSVIQPEVDYNKIYARLNDSFNFSDSLSVEEFQQRAEAIISSLKTDGKYNNITSGVAVPFILPKAQYDDIGEALEQEYLGAVEKSFNEKFPDYSFTNHCTESLKGKFSVVQGSRHQKLLEAMQNDVVVGIYFPCLLEYSVPAAIEQEACLPEQFLLGGGFDTAAAFIGSPDLLLRTDGYPPLLWLSGLSAEKEGIGYHFEAYGYSLTFNRRAHLGHVAEYWASGLVVID